jgi:hypothetical protein
MELHDGFGPRANTKEQQKDAANIGKIMQVVRKKLAIVVTHRNPLIVWGLPKGARKTPKEIQRRLGAALGMYAKLSAATKMGALQDPPWTGPELHKEESTIVTGIWGEKRPIFARLTKINQYLEANNGTATISLAEADQPSGVHAENELQKRMDDHVGEVQTWLDSHVGPNVAQKLAIHGEFSTKIRAGSARFVRPFEELLEGTVQHEGEVTLVLPWTNASFKLPDRPGPKINDKVTLKANQAIVLKEGAKCTTEGKGVALLVTIQYVRNRPEMERPLKEGPWEPHRS